MITLIQDNNDKLKIQAPKELIEFYAKKTLGWRTPTRKYNSIYDRLIKAGSTSYDKVIEVLYQQGYKLQEN